MLRLISSVVLSGALVLMSGAALAGVFDEADRLYQERGNSLDAVKSARAAYSAHVGAVRGDDLIHGVARLCALDIIQGDNFTEESNNSARAKLYYNCWAKVIEKISPSAVGSKLPQYYYWKAYALALWGSVAPSLRVILQVSNLKSTLAEGLALDTRYQGGGILRIAGGVHLNKKARAFGLYDPEGAQAEVEAALDSEAYPGDPNSGAEYYTNHKNFALVLIELGEEAEAKGWLEEVLAEIDPENLPQGLEPETMWEVKRMQDILQGL